MVHNVVMTHLTVAGFCVIVIQFLKNSKSPYLSWIGPEKDKVLRVIAMVTSGLTAIGINYTWNPTTRVLSFAIPTLAAMGGLAFTWVKTFLVQEGVYRATVKNGTASALAEILKLLQTLAAAQGVAPGKASTSAPAPPGA